MSHKKTKEEFVAQANIIHGNKYSYDEFVYVNNKIKGIIICPIHGFFLQSPNNHLNGSTCPKCSYEERFKEKRSDSEEFINKAILVHNNKYDYSKVKYVNSRTKVCIICPEHGEFWQTPNDHLLGKGCNLCGGRAKLNSSNFILNAKEVHGDKYDYSKVKYVNNKTKVCIICPEHGEFWQTPNNHVSNRQGCPFCKDSHLERETHIFLNELNINHDRTAHFDWLGKQHLDFYLPEYFIAIECQGKQHFEPCTFGGISKEEAKENLIYVQELDERKSELCKENNIFLEYINYNDDVEKRINEIIEKYNIHYG